MERSLEDLWSEIEVIIDEKPPEFRLGEGRLAADYYIDKNSRLIDVWVEYCRKLNPIKAQFVMADIPRQLGQKSVSVNIDFL